MNIGIVTAWFERGAAYVSRQYMEVLQKEHNVFIYARSGESYAIGDPEWDLENVYWSKKINSPFTVTVIHKKEFVHWIKSNNIQVILFNEQHWWEPLLWCRELNVKTIAYIDYYTEETVPLFGIYDLLICNTKKHLQAFNWHKGAKFIPWGTDIDLFSPVVNEITDKVVFFHSCGMNPKRKGTDLLLKATALLEDDNSFKLIIHTQTNLKIFFPDLAKTIDTLLEKDKLEVIQKTVKAPGLFHLGDVYVYPSRLEGIGLTVAEAISSGLGIIVPDCGPMNEFVENKFGEVVKIDKFFARHDGYYWPQNEVDVHDLAIKMQFYMKKGKEYKFKARQFAIENLDWKKNALLLNAEINDLQEQINNLHVENSVMLIEKFEKKGLRKYNSFYCKFNFLFKYIRR